MLSTKRNKIALAVGSAILFGGSVSFQAIAEDADGAKQQNDNVEVIEVRGIRRSLAEATNTKRFATAVVDAVSAEDIGKLPDANVAEALGRIPGVTVSRQFGEGDAVSIRGASNQLTLTTLNGQNIASAGWYSQQAIDRTFNYSMLPPEIIGGINVYKSSQADLLEGGVGGTVVVNTRKPLSMDSGTVFGSIKATDSSATNDNDVNYSGLVSWKNEQENFGILAAFASSQFTLERRGNEGLPAWGGRIAPTHFRQERERDAYDIVAQFAPSENLEFSAHAMRLELAADSVNTAIWIPQNLANCASKNAQNVPTKCTTTAEWAADHPIDSDTYWDVRPRNATMITKSLSADATYKGDGFKVVGQIGKSDATGGTNFETNMAYITGLGGAVGTIDATGDVVQFDLQNSTFPLPSKGEYMGWEGLQSGQVVKQPRVDEEKFGQVDIEFDTEFGVVTSIKTGVRVSSHDIEQNAFRPVNAAFDGAAEVAKYNGSDFTNGTLTAGMDHFVIPAPDAQAMIDYTRSAFANDSSWVQDRSGYGTINEKTKAFYVMANIESGAVRGNVGVRYVKTDATATAFKTDPTYVNNTGLGQNAIYTAELVETDASYSKVLPSLNLAYDLQEDVILRASIAKVMARPNYDDMFTIQKLNGYSDNIPNNETVVTGNPGLSPFSATQADVGVEWYFTARSLFAASLFWKKIDTFTTFGSVANQSIGVVSPDTNKDSWLVQTKIDGEGGDIKGIELQLQHSFDSGFGVMTNVTLADASADVINYSDRNDVFSDSSKTTVNLVGFYENDDFSARAAYAWRSAYMIRETGFYGAREHQDFGTLDLSFTYNATENVTIVADVTNVLKEDSVQLGHDQTTTPTFWRTSEGYPAYTYEGEARYSLGVQFRF